MRSIPLGSMIFLLLRRAGFPFFKEIWNEMTASIKEVLGHPLRDGAIIFGGLIRFNRMPVVALAQHAGERRHAYLEQIAAQIVAI